MKILFYINTLANGGAERVMSCLATDFSENHHECVIVTSFPTENEYDVGNNVKRISLFSERLNCSFFKRNLRLTNRLRKHIKSEQPDIVIAFMAEPNFRAIIASLGLNNKVLVSVRNDPIREYPTAVLRFLAKTLFRLADGIVFQTEDAKKWAPLRIQKKCRIIFNQISDSFYNVETVRYRRDIVTTGRLTEQKNHKMLIRAFASIANKIEDNLIIYGEGELRGELEALVSELHMEKRIFLPGVTKDVAKTILSAKLFVLSSDYEGMPNSLMEAMAMGIPCISTNCPCGGPRMLFGELLADRLIACGDEKGLCEKIEKMISQNVTGENEKLLSEQFRPEIIVRKWEDYIEDICGQRERNGD